LLCFKKQAFKLFIVFSVFQFIHSIENCLHVPHVKNNFLFNSKKN
jgi:hypothetical protein